MRAQEAVSRRILDLCEKNDMKVNRLCAICGITQSTLQNIISGRSNTTTIATIQKVCDGLEIELPDFFDSELFRGLEQEIQ